MALSKVAVNPNALDQFLESVREEELPEKGLKIPNPDAQQRGVSRGQGFDHSPAQFTDNGLIGARIQGELRLVRLLETVVEDSNGAEQSAASLQRPLRMPGFDGEGIPQRHDPGLLIPWFRERRIQFEDLRRELSPLEVPDLPAPGATKPSRCGRLEPSAKPGQSLSRGDHRILAQIRLETEFRCVSDLRFVLPSMPGEQSQAGLGRQSSHRILS
jgi:hypothetical protein